MRRSNQKVTLVVLFAVFKLPFTVFCFKGDMRQLYFVCIVFLFTVSTFQNIGYSQPAFEEKPIVMSYRVSDLPVWKIARDGKAVFDPSILISAIKTHVAPDSWTNPSHRIHFERGQPSLAIFQTHKNHGEIALVLRRMYSFSEHSDLSDMEKSFEIGKAKKQRILLYVGDPNSIETHQIFKAFYSNAKLKVLASNFILKCIRPSHTPVRNITLKLPKLGTKPEFVVLDKDKNLIARAKLDSISKSGTFDIGSFESFLELHRPLLGNAVLELDKAINIAAKNDKHVLLQMSGPNCIPCERLKKFFDENHKVIAKDFVYLQLDRRMPKAEEVKKSVGILSEMIPWTAIVSNENKVIRTSEIMKGKNIGYPSSVETIHHFRQMISSGSGRITEAQLNGLMKKLKK